MASSVTPALMALLLLIAAPAVAVPQGADPAGLDCAGWLGSPESGTPRWSTADLNNQRCAAEGYRLLQESPAVVAAKAANASAGDASFTGDPFRAPRRWADRRGRYQEVTYTDRDGTVRPAALFGPRDIRGGPYPGVVLPCHACLPVPNTTGAVGVWYWAAEMLAEAGYVVLYANIGGNSVDHAIDATDYFVSTPAAPAARGEVNPWHDVLDPERLGIIGHSGAGGVSLTVGHRDPRFDAIVAWDPAGSFTFTGINPSVPTMVQVADYTLREGPVPRAEQPVATPGSKFTFYDSMRDAGIDVMQVAPRATTHLDWTRFVPTNPFGPSLDHSVYGEMVAAYYSLAWLDRYVGGAPEGAAQTSDRAARAARLLARDASRRLTASGAQAYDRSADRFSIGAGFFDADRVGRRDDPEAGNVPVRIAGVPIRNLLSFQYPSRYSFEGGTIECDDMRAGCR